MASLSEGLRSFSAVIVTGGSSGIGKSFIGLIQSVNADLHFCNLSRSEPAIKSAGLKLHHIAVDLARPADLPAAVEAAEGWLREVAPSGRVLLINNSGFGGYGEFPRPEIGHNLEMIDLNVRAVVDLTGRLLPVLRVRGGAIINVASTAALQPTPWMSVYGATKAFLLHWSLALREELRPKGIDVLAVCPGPTGTQFFRRAGLRQGSVNPALSLTSDEVARQSLQALVNGRGLVVTGWKNKVGAAVLSKLPKVFAAWLAAKVLARFRLRQVAP